jgi:amino acid adenylation domain-containing protein
MNTTICNLFAQQVRRQAHQIAVVSSTEKLTYQELNDRSNQVAFLLKSRGFLPGGIVAIALHRSVNLIAGILGILKAGGAYLPLDPLHPWQRNRTILRQSEAAVLLTDRELHEQVLGPDLLKCNAILYFDEVSRQPTSTPDTSIRSDDLAYVLFTSGSTGHPKGAMIEHRNVVNLVHGLHTRILSQYASPLNIALVAPIIFDASVQQIFPTLLLGHTLCIAPETARFDAQQLARFFDHHQIDISDGTPAHLKLLFHRFRYKDRDPVRVGHFLIGGEELKPHVVKQFLSLFDHPPEITNVYGPAECCVDSSSYNVDLNEIQQLGCVPIGSGLPNVHLQVLNDQLEPVAAGEEGELCISGSSVGRGYLGQSDLTRDRFVSHPKQPEQRLYRTGDLVRSLPDGKLQFLGRRDRQVKLRGYRIDLGEIEAAMSCYKASTLIPEQKSSLRSSMQRCDRCLLDSTYPGVKVEDDVCSVCLHYDKYKTESDQYFQSLEAFCRLMDTAKLQKKSDYDCLLLYSGGKDSTYVLYRLIELGYNVFAVTFDNGFISKTAFANIARITQQLGVQHEFLTAENMNEIFVESLKTDSTVCGGCFRGLTLVSQKFAQDKGINVIITGLSRGQIFETKLQPLLSAGIYSLEKIEVQLRLQHKIYHARADRIAELLSVPFNESSIDQTHFVDFFRYEFVTVPQIKQFLSSQDNHWLEPQDTGVCSTNCKINSVGIFVHQLEKGFHNYAAALSWDCRLGLLSKDEGVKALQTEIAPDQVQEILDQLRYQPNVQSSQSLEVSIEIQDVAVTMHELAGEPCLAAYFVANQPVDIEALRSYLLKLLPSYMVPIQFVQLESLPITQNGKLDLDALDKLKLKELDLKAEKFHAHDQIEAKLLNLWEEVLERPGIDINDDFFRVGGDSINVTILLSLIEKEFQITLPFEEAFQKPTIKYWATLLRR